MENVGVAGTLHRDGMMADEAKQSAIDRLCGLWFADGVSSPVYRVQQGGAGWNWIRAESPIPYGFRCAETMVVARQDGQAPRAAGQGRADACGAQGEGMNEASTVGMWETDSAGRTIFVCSKWSEITGFPPEKAVGHGWLRAIDPEDLESAARQWRRAVTEKLAFIISVRFVHAGGKVVRALCQAAPVMDQGGQGVRWVGTLLEVPEETRTDLGRPTEPMTRGGWRQRAKEGTHGMQGGGQ
jgi:PAS domain S-box-containing protein